MPNNRVIPVEAYTIPPDITSRAVPPPPTDLISTIGQGAPQVGPVGTIEQAPDPLGFTIKRGDSRFFDLSPEDQQKYRLAAKYGGLDKLGFGDIEPPEDLVGNLFGVQRAFLRGLGVPESLLREVRGVHPGAEVAGEVAGEVAKYATIYRALGSAGIAELPVVPHAIAGLTSGAIRQVNEEDPSLQRVADEASLAALGGAAFDILAPFRGGLASAAPQTRPSTGGRGVAEAVSKDPRNPYKVRFDDAEFPPGFEQYTVTEGAGREFSVNFKKGETTPESLVKRLDGKREAFQAKAVTEAPLVEVTPQEQAVTLNFFGYSPELAQSLQKDWNGVVDKTWEKVLEVIPKNVTSWVRGKWYGNAPELTKEILRQRERGITLGRQEAVKLGETIKGEIPRDLQFDVFKTLDPTAFGELGVLPAEYRAIVGNARNRIDELGAEWVELGLGPAEVYQKNVGEYLARYYSSKEPLFKRARSKIGRLFIRGDRSKKRTLKTIAQREKAGLITDPAYAVARTVADLTFDIETAKAFRGIARNPEWAQPAESFANVSEAAQAGFKRVPKDGRYGDLSDMWLQRDVADEIFSIARPNGGDTEWISGTYDKMLGLWKLGKTAWSPATHGRNWFSNIILADVGAGLSPTRVDVYAKAAREYFKKGPLYREAEKTGLFGTDWFGAEVGQVLSPDKMGQSRSIFDVLDGSTLGRVVRAPGNLYQGSEHFFKMAVFTHQRSLGATAEQAAQHAQKYLFNYSELSPFFKKLRRNPFGGPFLTFTAKALPIMIESSIRRPVRFWKYPIMIKTMHEYSKARLGIGEEEWKNLELSLPEWRRNGWNVMLPWRSTGGNPRLVDLTYNLPWGQIGESPSLLKVVESMVKDVPLLREAPLGLVDPFVGSNPFTNIAADIAFNRNRFLDKPLFLSTDTGLEALGKVGGHAFRQFAPGFLLAIPPSVGALSGKPTEWGQRLDVTTTLLNKLVGIRVTDIEAERGIRIKVGALRKEAEVLRSEAFQVKAKHEAGGITDEEYHARILVIEGKAEDLEGRADELEAAFRDVSKPDQSKEIKTKPVKVIPSSAFQ